MQIRVGLELAEFSTLFNRGGNRRAFRLAGAGGGSFPLYGGTFARSYSVSKFWGWGSKIRSSKKGLKIRETKDTVRVFLQEYLFTGSSKVTSCGFWQKRVRLLDVLAGVSQCSRNLP